MPRYVILRHEGSADYKPGVHWDLMLEAGLVLRTWALAEEPAANRPIAAEQLPDHRPSYLDYEGPVSGNRGSVTRWDTGQFELLEETPLSLVIALAGGRLQGRATLTRDSADNKEWQFSLT